MALPTAFLANSMTPDEAIQAGSILRSLAGQCLLKWAEAEVDRILHMFPDAKTWERTVSIQAAHTEALRFLTLIKTLITIAPQEYN